MIFSYWRCELVWNPKTFMGIHNPDPKFSDWNQPQPRYVHGNSVVSRSTQNSLHFFIFDLFIRAAASSAFYDDAVSLPTSL